MSHNIAQYNGIRWDRINAITKFFFFLVFHAITKLKEKKQIMATHRNKVTMYQTKAYTKQYA